MQIDSINQQVTVSDEIPSLLLPMVNKQLLLPTVSVAEMLPFKEPQKSHALASQTLPDWYLGDILWRGIYVPMVSYEAINGGTVGSIKGVSQVAVLNNVSNNPQLPFICIPTQGIPRLSRVTPGNIDEDTTKNNDPYDQLCVVIAGDFAAIPDIAKIEQAYINLL